MSEQRNRESVKSPKVQIIEAIQEKGRFWDPVANQDAWEAAREPQNENKRLRAARSVAIADVARKQADEIIDLVQ